MRPSQPLMRLFVAILATAALLCANASSFADITAGNDYFHTVPGVITPSGCTGTWVELPILPGQPIPLMGVPGIVPGTDTDTIVQRKADAKINGGPVPIEIVALNLKSVSPVDIGGSFFDVFVQLGPMQTEGQIAIGPQTFSSTLPVFADITLRPLQQGGQVFVFSHPLVLQGTDLPWSHHAVANVFHSDHFCPLCLHGQPSDGTELGMLAAHGIVPATILP